MFIIIISYNIISFDPYRRMVLYQETQTKLWMQNVALHKM